MRGKRISKAARKVDVIVESVRYDPGGKRLALARGYQRRGYVWGDRVLFDRETLIELVKSKMQVFAGHPAQLEGDFKVIAPIHLQGANGGVSLVAEGFQGQGDRLGVPLF